MTRICRRDQKEPFRRLKYHFNQSAPQFFLFFQKIAKIHLKLGSFKSKFQKKSKNKKLLVDFILNSVNQIVKI